MSDSDTLGGSTGAPATGGSTGAGVAGGVGTATRSPNGGASRLGRLVSGLPLPVHDHETPATGGAIDYLRTAWGDDHLDPDGDPHDQYATDADLATALAGYLTPAAADALFLTPAEGDARYAAAGSGVDAYTKTQSDARYEPLDSAYTKAEADARYLTAAGADALFLTPAEGDAAYAAVDHTHPQVTTGEFHFQTNPAMTDPGTGNFRSNTGAAATATALAMDQIGAGGTDITTLFNAMRTADTIFVQDKNDAAQWVRYQLTAPPTINSGWATVPVSVIASGGTIAGSQLCVMQLTLTAGGGGGAGGLAADALWDAKGDLVAASANNAAARLAVGTNGQVLTADSAQTLGVKWATPAGGGALATDPLADAKGDLFAASGADAVGRLALGTNGHVLTADSTQALGVKWAAAGGGGGVSSVDGQTGAVDLAATYVNVTGDTLTGTLVGPTVRATTALVVQSAIGATARVYGAGSPAFAPGATPIASEMGVRFRGTTAVTLTGCRWYRTSAGQTVPPTVRLWDTTSTASPVATFTGSDLAAFADTATGWKTATFGAPQTLVAGRDYVLSYDHNNTNLSYQTTYTPVPDAPLVFVDHRSGTRAVYPTTTGTSAFAIDPVVTGAPPPVAAAGEVRLPNVGALAWRNAADTADLSLSLDASDRLALAVGAGSLTTTAPSAGGAGALPATPAGYVAVVLNGVSRRIAFY